MFAPRTVFRCRRIDAVEWAPHGTGCSGDLPPTLAAENRLLSGCKNTIEHCQQLVVRALASSGNWRIVLARCVKVCYNTICGCQVPHYVLCNAHLAGEIVLGAERCRWTVPRTESRTSSDVRCCYRQCILRSRALLDHRGAFASTPLVEGSAQVVISSH